MFKKYKSHLWHGVSIGNLYPDVVTAFIEMVPTDTVKYEVDKETGSIDIPGMNERKTELTHVYDVKVAYEVIQGSIADYLEFYGDYE